MEHRETYTPAPVTVAGITIEVDVALSVSLWHPARGAVAGSVRGEPMTIRITTGGKTVGVNLSEFTADESRSIIGAD
jgi:hypothetical protein